jgi:hypothetical protein
MSLGYTVLSTPQIPLPNPLPAPPPPSTSPPPLPPCSTASCANPSSNTDPSANSSPPSSLFRPCSAPQSPRRTMGHRSCRMAVARLCRTNRFVRPCCTPRATPTSPAWVQTAPFDGILRLAWRRMTCRPRVCSSPSHRLLPLFPDRNVSTSASTHL